MYPKDVPDNFYDQSNYTSIDNSSDALKKVWSALEGGKKCGVKPVSNIKADKTHEDWNLSCEAYLKMASRYINMKRSSFLNSSHCAARFIGTKI